jgi:hypothetical protein
MPIQKRDHLGLIEIPFIAEVRGQGCGELCHFTGVVSWDHGTDGVMNVKVQWQKAEALGPCTEASFMGMLPGSSPNYADFGGTVLDSEEDVGEGPGENPPPPIVKNPRVRQVSNREAANAPGTHPML